MKKPKKKSRSNESARIHLKKKKKSEKGGVSETESVKAEKQKSERESAKSLKKKKEQSEKGSAEKSKKAKKQEDVSTSSKRKKRKDGSEKGGGSGKRLKRIAKIDASSSFKKGKSKIVEVGGTLGRSLSRRKTLSGSRGFSFEEEEIIREDVTQPSISMDGDTPSDKVMSEEVAKSHDSSQSRTERGGKKKWSPVKDQSLIYESGSFKRKTKARRIRKVISLKKSKKRVKRKDREGAKRKAAEQDKMNKEKPASWPQKEEVPVKSEEMKKGRSDSKSGSQDSLEKKRPDAEYFRLGGDNLPPHPITNVAQGAESVFLVRPEHMKDHRKKTNMVSAYMGFDSDAAQKRGRKQDEPSKKEKKKQKDSSEEYVFIHLPGESGYEGNETPENVPNP
ncbi:hypothetical protein TELCIR_08834, partial [Teladorsagia circumcincta]